MEPRGGDTRYPPRVSLSGKYLYAADVTSSIIHGFDIDSTIGITTLRADSPWPDDNRCQGVGLDDPMFDYNPSSLAIDPGGKFLYALNSLDQDIAIYSIADNGALTFLKFTSQGSACSGAVRIDLPGSYLYAGACPLALPAGLGGLVGFSIDPATGDLSPLPTSPYTYPQAGSPLPSGLRVVDNAITP